MRHPATPFAPRNTGAGLPDRGHAPAPPGVPKPLADTRRVKRGALAYRAGLAAEEAALRVYRREGAALLCQRRRRAEGEIDLVLREGDCIVFVEVKRRKAPVQEDPVTPSQWQRLEAAAERYMLDAGTGDMPLRFDLALVDQMGAVEVIKNARM